jgi:3-methyladenine DNA glycosylase AlkD
VKLQEALRQLEALGTEQNRKVYRRHGVGENAYGVSYAALEKLKKAIKKDHALAVELWATGNHDARILATMIADPRKMTGEDLDAWAEGLGNSVETDAFSKLAAGSPLIRQKIDRWTEADHEWIESAGWNLLAHLALKDGGAPDDDFEKHLAVIERDIHTRKNRVRYAMNSALIAIGGRNETLMRKALAAAARIGKVAVDHGETGCKTPEAADYIQKMLTRKKK